MGYQGGTQTPPTDIFGVMHFDFNTTNKPTFEQNFETEMNFYLTNTSLCDSSGNLICYSNGIRLFDSQHNLVQNGNNLVGPDNFLGYSYPQGALLLPTPGHKDRFTMFSIEEDPIERVFGKYFFYHTIERTANNTLKVTEKRKLIVQDSLSFGMLSAIKHANGRDWWLLMPAYNSNVIHRVLLSPKGIQHDTIHADFLIVPGLGQSVFSTDGTKYIIAIDSDLYKPADIYIHDFDRCTGRLYNGVTKKIDSPGTNFGAGCAVSPDSRYLYVIHTAVIFQYDLWASDILATETLVGQYDDFVSGWYGSYFMFGQTGADGRIYISSWVGTFHMHEINFPHRASADCSVRNHSIASPVYLIEGIPNFPHFRMGPVDGSACDTLGLDNHPLCNWRWETEDTLAPLAITFTDLSTYQPDTWRWDFGDGTGEIGRYQEHTYAQPGLYRACLIVSNVYSTDTFCQMIPLGIVSSSEELAMLQQSIRIGPNPFNDQFLCFTPEETEGLQLILYDQLGHIVKQSHIIGGVYQQDTHDLPAGLYFWDIWSGGRRVKAGRAVKMNY